jgi:protein kinase-like protein
MVAIKTIRLEGLAAQGAGLDELVKRFKVEAMVSAQLKHPNIVTIYDVGESDGMSYLAMEFLDGSGLDRIIANQGRLPVERAALIAAQVADALDFAHKNNVVHRDIKPANIMIEAGDRVKVTDFGIAKATDSAEHLTVTGSLLGTPSYMSPEQAKGAALDGRSDLFAVGCVLYEMLAGKKAFRGDSITALIFKIITEEPPPITEIDPLIPEPMVRIVTKALSKAPEARYQSGRALADDLLALTRGTSWPTMRQTETPTEVGSPPTLAATVSATTGTPSTGPAPTVATPATARPPAARPSPPPPRPAPTTPARSGGMSGLLLVGGIGLVLLLVLGLAVGWYVMRSRRGPAEVVKTEPAPATAAPASAEIPATAAPTAAAAGEPTTAPTAASVATLPPTTDRRPAEAATPKPGTATAAANTAPASAAGDEYAYLDDEEAASTDGGALGARVAGAYRSERGGGGSRLGTSVPLRRRPRSPANLGVRAEKAAVATLRHLINAELAFQKREGRYGNLSEIIGARLAHLDVKHSGNGFERAGYRFELTTKDDGFEAVALPQSTSLRPFKGDDSEYITVGVE